MKKVLIAALPVAAAVAFGVGIASGDGVIMAQRHSCGYHCNLDGSAATPAAPPQKVQIEFAGRTDVHSSGHGRIRHGGGGHSLSGGRY